MAGFLLAPCIHADTVAVVTANRVNLRGRPTLSSEVVTQVQEGETVVVLDSFRLSPLPRGDVAQWHKIRLPEDTPVWVHASHVDSTTRRVTASRLNVRAGPGQKYSILGHLDKGDSVREIRVVDDWMEIEPPSGTCVYMAAAFARLESAALSETPAPRGNAAPQPVGQSQAAVNQPAGPTPNSQPGPVADTPSPGLVATPPLHPSAPVATSRQMPPPPIAAAPSGSLRIVQREGVLLDAMNIQAPARHKLRSPVTGRDLNFLVPASDAVQLALYRGQRVVITGEERSAPGWPNLPILEVRSIQLAP